MASNREALRKLSRQFPAPPEVDKIIYSLKGEKDMSVAIVAAAILEASLERLITSKLVENKDSDLIGQLFLNRGPMSDFHSKILIAQAFGIITSNMAHELHSIKAIRNTFAHAKVPISFDHDLLSKELDSLKLLTAIKNTETTTGHKFQLTQKSWFLLATKMLMIMFDEIARYKRSANKTLIAGLKKDGPARKASL
jgi:DNA-binding MltR family transcriptional regulator